MQKLFLLILLEVLKHLARTVSGLADPPAAIPPAVQNPPQAQPPDAAPEEVREQSPASDGPGSGPFDAAFTP